MVIKNQPSTFNSRDLGVIEFNFKPIKNLQIINLKVENNRMQLSPLFSISTDIQNFEIHNSTFANNSMLSSTSFMNFNLVSQILLQNLTFRTMNYE